MDKNPFLTVNLKLSLSLCAIFILGILFIGCSNSAPNIISVDAKVVYDFETEASSPVQKLNVFLRMDSDVRRIDCMTVYHKETGYRWVIHNPLISQSDNIYYAGFTNLSGASQNGEALPQGEYSVFYIDASGRECYGEFSIKFDADPQELKATEVMKNYDSSTQFFHVGLYSDDAILIYYGAPKKDWQISQNSLNLDSKKLFAQYKDASFYRVFNYRDNNVFILPKVQKTVEYAHSEEVQ